MTTPTNDYPEHTSGVSQPVVERPALPATPATPATPEPPEAHEPGALASDTAQAEVADDAPALTGWTLAATLASLLVTLLLGALDQTVVATAEPHIIGDLHGFSRYTWVFTAYLLASTTAIPILGKLSDQFGRKWLLLGTVSVFLASSALAGASQTMNQLIVFRGMQGLGAGGAQALVFILVADIFPPRRRARWVGLFTGVFGLASVIGPAVGGWLTDTTTWRWVFYVNLPLGVVALVALAIWLPTTLTQPDASQTSRAAWRRIDALGALTAAGATVCLLLGLSWGGQTYPWSSAQVVGLLIAAAALFVIFFVVERFAAEPILPLDLFRSQVMTVSAVLTVTANMALFALVIYLPLYIQGVLGHSATSSGVAIIPLTLAVTVGAVVGGLIVARLGRYQLTAVAGALIMTGGVYLMTRMTASSPLLDVTRNMIVVGLGVGLLQPITTLAAQNVLPREQLGVGTSALSYLRSLGSTLAVALIGSVVTNAMNAQLVRTLPPAAHQLPAQALAAATNPQLLVDPGQRASFVHAFIQGAVHQAAPQAQAAVAAQATALLDAIFAATRQALLVGVRHAFVVSLIICGLTCVAALFLRDVPFAPRALSPAPPAPGEGS